MEAIETGSQNKQGITHSISFMLYTLPNSSTLPQGDAPVYANCEFPFLIFCIKGLEERHTIMHLRIIGEFEDFENK